MKKLRVLLMLLFGILFLSCEKEDNEKDLNLNKKFLRQTAWRGTITWNNDDLIAQVGFLFSTEDRGTYEVKDQYDKEAFRGDFNYSLNDRLLIINVDELRYHLKGDWLLVEKNKSKDKLIFKRNIHDDVITSTLELIRIN